MSAHQVLRPMELGSKINVGEEHTNGNGPTSVGCQRKIIALIATHVSNSIAESKLVLWYAFTTKKFPSTSAAARMKSDNRQLEVGSRDYFAHFHPSLMINLPHPLNPSVDWGSGIHSV
jgi:hypothetical protein